MITKKRGSAAFLDWQYYRYTSTTKFRSRREDCWRGSSVDQIFEEDLVW